MSRKSDVRDLLKKMAIEVYEFIKESETSHGDREGKVPATFIKEKLGLNLNPYPMKNKTQGQRGWLFGIIARMLEDGVEGKYLVHWKDPQTKRSFYSIKR